MNDSFPIELISRVFSYALVPPSQGFDLQYNHTRAILLTVCKYWSNVVLNNPQFWTKFYLDFKYRRRLVLSPLKAWLQRSANMPIDIFVDDLPRVYESFTKKERIYRRRILQILLQHISRWRKLALRASCLVSNLVRDAVDFSRAEQLVEVSLCCECLMTEIPTAITLALEEAPALRSVRFCRNVVTLKALLEQPSFTIFGRLSRLDLPESLFHSVMFDVMRRCVCAEHISIGVVYNLTEPDIRVSLEKLCILELTFGSDDHNALTRLDLPNLKVLFISRTEEGGDSITHVVSGFIDGNSGRSLQVLKLENFSMDALDGGIVQAESLRRIPIFQVQIRSTTTADEVPLTLSEGFWRWKEIDSRFKMCRRGGNADVWSIGWIDYKTYVECQQSLPDDVFDSFNFGLLN